MTEAVAMFVIRRVSRRQVETTYRDRHEAPFSVDSVVAIGKNKQRNTGPLLQEAQRVSLIRSSMYNSDAR